MPFFLLAALFLAPFSYADKFVKPRGFLDNCPKPFAGTDNGVVAGLNELIVYKMPSLGKAPSDKDLRAILESASAAAKDKTLLGGDVSEKEVKSFELAAKAKKFNKGTASGNGCSIDVSVWNDFAVLWHRTPCQPAVMLFEKKDGKWAFVCITEYINH